jgi:hypothetical protein
MRDYLEIDTVPTEEDCAQVNAADYPQAARREARAYIAQILRHYPAPIYGDLCIKRNAHDFGEYLSVKIIFDDTDEESCNWAYDIESDKLGVLREWDSAARAELGLQTA